MKDKEEELVDAHAELFQLRDERDRIIDAYMEKDEFVQVMRAHEDAVFPYFFRSGWNAGVSAVQEYYPDLNPGDYQCPDDAALIQKFRRQATIFDSPMPDAAIAETITKDSETSSGETASDEGSSSGEKEEQESAGTRCSPYA